MLLMLMVHTLLLVHNHPTWPANSLKAASCDTLSWQRAPSLRIWSPSSSREASFKMAPSASHRTLPKKVLSSCMPSKKGEERVELQVHCEYLHKRKIQLGAWIATSQHIFRMALRSHAPAMPRSVYRCCCQRCSPVYLQHAVACIS